MKEVEIGPTLWLEITDTTFTLVKDYADYSPLAHVDLDREAALKVYEHLAKFLGLEQPLNQTSEPES